MLFNSYSYLLFLPVAFTVYWLLGRRTGWQNLFVVAASYFFYACWDWRFLSLILLTSLSSYAAGLLMCRKDMGASARKAVNAVNIVLNVGILCTFKYLGFFADSLGRLLSLLGLHADMPTLHIILPVGISFYTFQAIGYSIDVYRRQVTPTRDVVAFAAFISFFPQLVAGPIERASHLLPQFLQPRRFSCEQTTDGCRQMLWGFFKKVVVADNCAVTVNMVWNDYAAYPAPMLILAAVLFSLQIYCDFSGYSDIAIGTAKLFGIRLCDNFRTPYLARSISDFWRRWHISLMTWLRDYIYIPLGGSRQGTDKTLRNTLTVFLVSGLWHGANFTFIVWGLYHALLFIPKILAKGHGAKAPGRRSRGRDGLSVAATFVMVTVGWVIFRAPTIADAGSFLAAIVSAPWTVAGLSGFKALAVGAVCLAVEYLQRSRRHALDFGSSGPMRLTAVRWLVYYVLIFSLNALSAQQESFIYFQF